MNEFVPPPHDPSDREELSAAQPPSPVTLVSTERRQLAMPLLAVVCIYLVTLVVQEVALLLIRSFAPALMRESWFLIVMSNTPMYLCGMPLSLLLFRFAKASPPQKSRLRFPAFLGLIAICFSVTIVGSMISTAISSLIERVTGQAPSNELQELTINTPLWANLLYVAILAPILEELFFRKLIIDRWRRWGDLPAILLSGLAFGLIHGNVGQVVYATLVGMVFGYIYILVFIALTFAFSYFYIMISFNPIEVSNNIRNNGGAVPGIRPGKPTADYIKKILNRITLMGALFLIVISALPMIVSAFAPSFSSIAFGGTSLLIIVGVALETVRDLEAQLAMRNYKGFLD